MEKIDRRRKYVLVLDIETANITEDALAYDVGFAVADKKGHIYETHSYMVAEMFLDNYNKPLMDTAYYAKKLPKYWEDYKAGKRKLAKILTIRRIVRQVMEKYRITDVFAYNANFDKTGLDRTVRYLTKSEVRFFFPYGTKIHCIWHMATQVICQQKTYFKNAIANNWISAKGNLQTSAELVFAYISGNPDFQEEHTGLEDVTIEVKIMAKCFAQHKRMKTNIYRRCWAIPQNSFKEFAETA